MIPLYWRAAILLLIVVCFPSAARTGDLFPLYPAIRANVTFWEHIYASLSVNAAVIHDREDLSRIYGTVSLVDANLPGASTANAATLQQAEEHCRQMLLRLANGAPLASAEEQKIASFFSGPTARQDMAAAAETVRSQRGLRERFLAGVVRSGAYMKEIKKIFTGYGLPAELGYLPHVESSFSISAYSKAGAAGAWQFTRATGKQFLHVSDTIDERLDPLLAADAAARYLRNSFAALNNWPLALTAYNYGTAGMVRAKEALGDYERIFQHYQEGHFKFASRNFYSEFLAAVRVAQRLEQDPAIALDKPVPSREYTLPRSAHIREIERHLQADRSSIGQLNPALLSPVIAGRTPLPAGYTLRLPITTSRSQLAAASTRTPAKSVGQAKKISTPKAVHQVRQGETVSSIAKRYNVAITDLIKVNRLGKAARVSVGQRLTIPAGYSEISKKSSALLNS